MFICVGLGNPGAKHANNRHNIGFMAVDAIAHRHNFTPWQEKFGGLICEGMLDGEKTYCFKPETYMNESGRAVGELCRFYKLDPDAVCVIYDEIDLPFGKTRTKIGGGAGGHNGIKSIDNHIGKEYLRVRLGVGHPGDKDRVSGYVLSDFSKEEMSSVHTWVDDIATHADLLAAGEESLFMTKLTEKK